MHSPRVMLVVLVAICCSSPALAQTDDDLAEQYYRLGAKLYERSDFKGALAQFEKSYDVSKRTPLLYNIARCHESLGQHELAIKYYNQYLATEPKNADLVKIKIQNLEKQMADSPASRPAETTPPPTTRPAETAPPPPPPPTEQTPAPRPLRLPGWILVGSGAALIITGVVLGAVARGKAKDIEEASAAGSEDFADYKSVQSSGQALQTGQIVGLAIGGAAAAAGAVLLFLDARSRRADERRAWVTPCILHSGAALTGTVRF